LDSADLTDLAPTEYRADAVAVLTEARIPVLAIVVEVQLRPDIDKSWTWPVYLTTLRARLRCPTMLMVVTVNAATARWCARPIGLGHPGLTLQPLVLGQDRVPVITDPAEAARSPELSLLSTMAHVDRPEWEEIADAVLAALDTIGDEWVALYTDVVLMALPDVARAILEKKMATRTYEYQSDFVRRHFYGGKAEGLVEGEATAILAVLDARGFEVPDDARARITGCTDLDQLDTWVRRAATAGSVEELFD
jgi:hypothetical protein